MRMNAICYRPLLRAGVVKNPSDWDTGGYREIQASPARYGEIDQSALMEIFGFSQSRSLYIPVTVLFVLPFAYLQYPR